MTGSAHDPVIDESPNPAEPGAGVGAWVDGWVGVVAIWAVAALYVLVAWVGVRGHASTFDEPLHVAAAVAAVQAGELGINPEHPPMWKYLAGLPHIGANTGLDLSSEVRSAVRGDIVAQWAWAVGGLYGSGTDGEAIVARSRNVMLLFGAGLVGVAGMMAKRLGGGLAGLITAGLISADPLVLGHGGMVSNDVALTVMLLGVVWLGWEIRRGARWDWAGGMGLGVLVGLAACTKFTGVVAAPVLAAGLLLLARKPKWGALCIAVLMAYVTVWAVYGFRYAPSPEGRLIDTTAIATRIGAMRQLAEGSTTAPPPDGATRMLLAIEKSRLFPQAMTAGLLTTYGVTRSNPAFALGMHSMTGWWWYFPFAMLVKVPLGLLVVWGLGVAAGVKNAGAGRAVVVCAGVLMLLSITSPLNIGVRHVLPVMALLTVAGGLSLAAKPRLAGALLTAVVLEVALVFPHTLAFFNLPARGIGEQRLLGDSNLDWGQDLARLADWRKQHPEGVMYLAYWGTAHPAAYGLDAKSGVVHLPDTYPYAPQSRPGPATGNDYVAVSISYLQGVQSGRVVPFFERLGKQEPVARVGKSILIYRR